MASIGGPSVAVAVDKDKGSQNALKWAVENLVSKGQTLMLVHVNTKPDQDEANYQKEVLVPFRCFCTRKDVQCKDIVLIETDVAKAIVEFVSQAAVEKLVVGAATRTGFGRFKSSDVPTNISRSAPDFCTVYVIAKGKVSSMRNAVRAAPASAAFRPPVQNQASIKSNPVETPRSYPARSPVDPAFETRSLSEDRDSIKSPFTRGMHGYNTRSYGDISFAETDISFVSSGRPSFDRSNHSSVNCDDQVEILSCIRHPNMVLLLGACPEYGCLVYEYMANGSLEDRLFRRGNTPSIPWQHRFRIAAEIGTGLLFLHQTKPEPLVHRDLKPANILLDRNYVSKISDVGLARLVPPSVADNVTQYRMTSTAGTFCYIDPEYQQTGMLGIKSDIYSLGIMLLQLITSRPPMGLTHHVERAIEKGKFEEMLDPTVRDWPVEDALSLANISLKCAELRRKDRPDLATVVLPELNRLRALGEDNMQYCTLGSAFPTPSHSQASSLVRFPASATQVNEFFNAPNLLTDFPMV